MIDANVIVDTFDPISPNYDPSLEMMRRIVQMRKLFVMPMHGWFEIQCNINKIKRKRGVLPQFLDGEMGLPIEFLHIDAKFLDIT
jgi:hypothetical protein